MNLKTLTIKGARKLLDSKQVSSVELFTEFDKRARELNNKTNSYITFDKEYSLKQAEVADRQIKEGRASDITGIPISVKDLFCTEGILTTAASNILSNFVPPFESTVTERLKQSGYVMTGKTNLDQFAHGSSNETSYYGFCHNPWDLERVPGGSSGGAAASLASGTCVFAMGTETAGSIRNPSAMCGLVGFKPTYGRVPRFGVISMGSSLDSPGPLTKSVEDAATVMDIIAGKDPRDMTSVSTDFSFVRSLDPSQVRNYTVGIPKEYMELEGITEGTRVVFNETVTMLEKLGAKVKEVSVMDPEISNWVYTIICRAEISSNLSRYDGMQYGRRSELGKNWRESYNFTRGEGFGVEAKRRIMTGTAVLSKGYESRLYKKANAVRELLAQDFDRVFGKVDMIISPVSPGPAIKLGSAEQNPLFGELMDIFNTASALCGLTAISLPIGFESVEDEKGAKDLPIGIQLFTSKFQEMKILNTGLALERLYGGFEHSLDKVNI